jgi:polygalacturonase
VLVLTACLAKPVPAKLCNVTERGSVGDGRTLDTEAINKTIETAANGGGGIVCFPPGRYLSYSICLKSNITLYLSQGAVIVAAEPTGETGYDPAEPNSWDDKYRYQDFGHSHWHDSLIWGENLENISILGPGIIDGSRGLDREDGRRPGAGNKIIALKLCRNVIIRDITMHRGGHFFILATGVDNLTIDNVKIDTNRDGINVDCCRNVRISNCTINSPNDDALVLKSSFALGYARATENVTITNCQVSGYDIGTLLDGTFRKTQERAPDNGGVTGRIKFGNRDIHN